MSGKFIDSNVFVYLFDETDDRKRESAERIVDSALQNRNASISFQVVQETLNVLTRKLPMPMTAEGAKDFLRQVLVPLWRVSPSPALYESAPGFPKPHPHRFFHSP